MKEKFPGRVFAQFVDSLLAFQTGTKSEVDLALEVGTLLYPDPSVLEVRPRSRAFPSSLCALHCAAAADTVWSSLHPPVVFLAWGPCVRVCMYVCVCALVLAPHVQWFLCYLSAENQPLAVDAAMRAAGGYPV